MSMSVGVVEKVPYARNCPVPSRLAVEIEFGRMVIETRGSPAPVVLEVAVTVSEVEEVTVPFHPAAEAVMVAVPAATPVASPPEVIVATPVLLDVQVTPLPTDPDEELLALPKVPATEYCTLVPAAMV
jgi:hypothetical protein